MQPKWKPDTRMSNGGIIYNTHQKNIEYEKESLLILIKLESWWESNQSHAVLFVSCYQTMFVRHVLDTYDTTDMHRFLFCWMAFLKIHFSHV